MTSTPTLRTVVNSIDLADAEVTFYQRFGYLSLPGFLVRDFVEPLREEVFRCLEARGLAREQLNQATETADKLRQYSDYLRGSLLDALINGENSVRVASQLIGGNAIRYLPFTAVKGGGGGGQFHFHQDNNYTRHDPALGSINIWVALMDMTPSNGCLQVVPQSHLQGVLDAVNAGDGDSHRKVQVDPQNFLPLRMQAGDAVAFTRLTVHGSGPNTTNQARVAYALQYHREDVRFYDPDGDRWQLLVDVPRFQTQPLDGSAAP